MPFTNTPEVSTYNTKTIALAKEINTRPEELVSKDEDFLNCYIDPIRTKLLEDKRTYVTKRPGTGVFLESVQAAPVRGIYYWADRRKILYAVNDDVYVYSLTSDTNTPLSAVFGTTSGDVGFCEYLYDTGTSVIVATDGTTLVTIDNSNTVTTCVDADLPVHNPYPVFLDGYLFVSKVNTGDIYNSDLNDPLTWTSGNFISAEIEGDWVIRIAKLNNYLIAFGKNTIEYFWDAGIETGSPLQRNDSVVKSIGYYGAFAQQGKHIYFIGNDTQGQLDVYQLEDLKITQLGTQVVSRYLNNVVDSYALAKGNLLSISGKNFYLIHIGNYTFVLDIETKIWTRWAFQANTNFQMANSVSAKKTNQYYSIFSLDANSSRLYFFSEDLHQDNEIDYTISIVTEKVNFDTANKKMMHRLVIHGDEPEEDVLMSVQWTDNDYKTYSNAVVINLNQDLPSAYRLGWFRSRAFKLSYTGNQPVRLEKLEVDLNKGIS